MWDFLIGDGVISTTPYGFYHKDDFFSISDNLDDEKLDPLEITIWIWGLGYSNLALVKCTPFYAFPGARLKHPPLGKYTAEVCLKLGQPCRGRPVVLLKVSKTMIQLLPPTFSVFGPSQLFSRYDGGIICRGNYCKMITTKS